MKNISCSLIVSTYNWSDALFLCIQSIFQQTKLPDEIVIADDGSKHETKELIKALAKGSPVPIVHIWHEDKGFRRTLIMNKAIKAAKYDYIVQTDGDIIASKNFIYDHLCSAEKGYFISGNRILLTNELTNEVMEKKKIKFSFFQKGLNKRHYAIRIPFINGLLKVKPNHTSTIIGCNLSFWKADFMAVNGYNNDIEGWGHEDIELVTRLVKYGVKCKKLRFSANCYHIYHPENSRNNEQANHNIYTSTNQGAEFYCNNGVKQA